MNTIMFRFSLTAKDYIKPMWAQLLRQWPTVVWLVMSAPASLLLVGYSLVAVAQSQDASDWLSSLPTLALVVPLAVPWLIYFVFMPLSMIFQVNQQERLRSEITGQADEQGMMIRTRFSEAKMDWGTFAGFFETKTYFVLTYTVNSQMIQIIPKRAFDSTQTEQAFRAMVQEQVKNGKIARRSSGRGAWLIPLIIITLIIAYAVMAFLR